MDGMMVLALMMAEIQLEEDAKRFAEQQKKKVEEKSCGEIKTPWDLLTADNKAAVERYMKEDLGSLAAHIDKNYIALIILLSKYEDVSIDAKVKLYLANKIAQRSDT